MTGIETLAALPKAKRDRLIRKFGDRNARAFLSSWDDIGRVEQRSPPGLWQFWLFLAGRGAGKTRAGAEWVRKKVKDGSGRIALIGPTAASARDVMVEGESGILRHAKRDDIDRRGNGIGRPIYEPSKRKLLWANGAIAKVYSAEEPERLRGPQHDTVWCDELASWPHSARHDLTTETWDMAMFGLRLGANPQAMISTTPKPIPILREMVRLSEGKNPLCVITRASTYANRPNLAGTFFSHIIQKYEGTRLGQQELLGLILAEAEGALWTRAMIEEARPKKAIPDLKRIVVGVDPAVTNNPTSNLTGIVVAGIGWDNRGYVLKDLSGRFTPDEWARRTVKAFDDYKADRIIAEGNQGGELVRVNLSTVRRNLPVRIVHASRSKQARAEPIAALYEQYKITHCEPFPELEDQLCTWQPLSGDESPDRLDALVWALSNLMLKFATELPIVDPVIIGTPRYWPGS